MKILKKEAEMIDFKALEGAPPPRKDKGGQGV